MNIFIDLATIIVIILIVRTGYRRGIVSVALRLFIGIGAFAAAYFISGIASQFLYDNFIRKSIVESITNAVASSADPKQMLENLPAFLKIFASSANITEDSLSALGSNIVNAVEGSVAPVVVIFIRLIMLPLLFSALMFLAKPISRLINRIFNLPLISAVNRILGAVLSIPMAFIILSTVSAFFRAFSPYFEFIPEIFSSDNINNTLIFRHLFLNDFTDFIFSLLSRLTVLGG